MAILQLKHGLYISNVLVAAVVKDARWKLALVCLAAVEQSGTSNRLIDPSERNFTPQDCKQTIFVLITRHPLVPLVSIQIGIVWDEVYEIRPVVQIAV